jgi:hypothetical protein
MPSRTIPAENGHGWTGRLLSDVIRAGTAIPLRPKQPAIRLGICIVLDIRQLGLSVDRRHLTSVLEASLPDAETKFVALRVADRLGVRSYPAAGEQIVFLEQVIPFAYSPTRAGQRPWLTCPGVNGAPCSTRAMKLYLPYDASRFACVECHGLTKGRGSLRYRAKERLAAKALTWNGPTGLHFSRAG